MRPTRALAEPSARIFPASVALPRLSVRTVALAFIALGIGLRLAQYLHNESLWLDEAFLALNLQNRSLGQLFGVLDYNQAAPPGYLFLEKVLASAFGSVISVALEAWVHDGGTSDLLALVDQTLGALVSGLRELADAMT